MDQQTMVSHFPFKNKQLPPISSRMPQISPLKHHLHSVLIACQEAVKNYPTERKMNSHCSSTCWCGQGPCHTCGFFSDKMIRMLHVWASSKGNLVFMLVCYRGCKDATLGHLCFFLSNLAFGCPAGWTIKSINLQFCLSNVSPLHVRHWKSAVT